MKIPVWLASVLVGAVLSGFGFVQGWTLVEVVNLKSAVAALTARFDGKPQQHIAINP